MKTKIWRFLLLFSLFSMLSAGAFAEGVDVALLGPQAGDLVPATLAARAPVPGGATSRNAVTFSWPLSPRHALTAEVPHRASSREYRVQVAADELARGVTIYTLAPGAVVRLNPIGSEGGGSLMTEQIGVRPVGRPALDGAAAIEGLVSDRQLRAAGIPFAAGTIAFRLRPEVGAGALQLSVRDPDAGRYLLHVLDAGSDLALDLQATRSAYLAGDPLAAELSFSRAGIEALSAEGWLVAPSGRTRGVEVVMAGRGIWRVGADLDGDAEAGLWELHLNAAGELDGTKVVRSVRTAFGVSGATARLSGSAGGELAKSGALTLAVGVETAAPGRYELRGVLYGSGAGGELMPFAAGHGAAWLEPGVGSVELRFDAALMAGSGLRPPYELRHLQLLDQGRMGLLQKQARGLVITP
ncbi:MAG: DUF4785 domain-containing protein [Acidobacteriota bacterium]